MPIEQAIRERRFAFSAARATFDMDVPPYTPPLQLVPPALADLFERTFRGDPSRRPSASDWHRELKSLRDTLGTCSFDAAHRYSAHLPDCPWCHLEQAGLPPLFGTASVSLEFDAGFDIDAFWRDVERLQDVPGIESLAAILSAIPVVPPRPLPEETAYRALGPVQPIPPPPELQLLPLPESPPFRPPLPDDPGSGYAPEAEPILQPFEPEVVPPDPVLTVDPLPPPPNANTHDYAAAPRQRAASLRRSAEYRIAKWSAIIATAVTCIAYAIGNVPTELGTTALAAGFGLVWGILAVRIHRAVGPALRSALAEQANAIVRRRERQLRYEAVLSHVDAANARRREEHRLLVADLARRRADLPHVNAERYQRWEIQRRAVEAQANAIRDRNAFRLREWHDRARSRVAMTRHAWEVEVIKVEAARERADAENSDRRRTWEQATAEHAANARLVAAANSRRMTAVARFGAELQKRDAAAQEASAAASRPVMVWNTELPTFAGKLADARSDLRDLCQRYIRHRASFEAERGRLAADSRRIQMDEHLRQHLIAAAAIPNVGEKRKQTLAAFGIETAFDVTDQQLAAVVGKGFGPVVFTGLRVWRTMCEQQFVFDPRPQSGST